MADSRIRGRQKGSSVVFNLALEDPRLSLKTIGLFAVMQSFPDDWEYSIDSLANHIGVGRDNVALIRDPLRAPGNVKGKNECAVVFGGRIRGPNPSTLTDFKSDSAGR